tara:strand:- start:128 stop:475 length:348 start_codon:yes stop_codon:yes gene_type:complete
MMAVFFEEDDVIQTEFSGFYLPENKIIILILSVGDWIRFTEKENLLGGMSEIEEKRFFMDTAGDPFFSKLHLGDEVLHVRILKRSALDIREVYVLRREEDLIDELSGRVVNGREV